VPYRALTVLGVLALVLRTASWTAGSARERRLRRGRSRWYDPILAIATIPRDVLVALLGTVVLWIWSAFLALLAGLGYLVFRGPLEPGLVLMGGVLALALWWGPGSGRLRMPARRLAATVTRPALLGWVMIAAVVVLAVLCWYSARTTGVDWAPAGGSPWDATTPLGGLLRWLQG
jgi:hypothetical protein